MEVTTMAETTMTLHEAEVSQAVRSLSMVLRATPELRAFLKAAQAIEADTTVQGLLRQIRTHQFALQWSQDNPADHSTALKKLRADLEAQPSVQAYYQAEQAAHELLQAVDALISTTAGVDFAANAKRSCCGG